MVAQDPLFACDGEMARRMSTHDWARLRSAARSGLVADAAHRRGDPAAQPLPDAAVWGEDLVMLYNDAFVPTLGTKHPGALGGLLPEVSSPRCGTTWGRCSAPCWPEDRRRGTRTCGS